MIYPETILSSCSAEASTSTRKASSNPAIHLHDLVTATSLHAFKTSSSALNSLAVIHSRNGLGGTIWAVQEGKAIANVWAWQKDQQHLKLHLPEKLSCIAISPNGLWMAGGSPNGQIYFWEIASGLMLASWNAHYRVVTSLTFSGDSHLLLSSSNDTAVHVFLVSRLLDDGSVNPFGKPYGTLGDHTLSITSVVMGKSAGSGGGRAWTASDDGTVKMWSLYPPFDLLSSFVLPPSAIPTTLAVDPSERFLYAGSTEGSVYLIPLFKRRAQIGDTIGHIDAVGGGPGGPPVKSNAAVISVGSPVTCLALSISASQLLIGTRTGDIHIHSLPSHQHLRTISSHAGPITYLSTMICPPDLVGTTFRGDDWPLMDIRNPERIRAGAAAKNVQEVGVLLSSSVASPSVDLLRIKSRTVDRALDSQTSKITDEAATLRREIETLKGALERAVKINEKMWAGVVDIKFGETQSS